MLPTIHPAFGLHLAQEAFKLIRKRSHDGPESAFALLALFVPPKIYVAVATLADGAVKLK